jgi:hypothetical protein
MRRVSPLVDAAFEEAFLPWATASRPGPADLAVGLGDRHLGWLGDLAETAALLRGTIAWEQAVSLPESSAGQDWDRERTYPGDALRWAAFAGLTPEEAEQVFLRPLWRLACLHRDPPLVAEEVPVRASQGVPGRGDVAGEELLDRWSKARLYQAAGGVEEALDAHDAQRAAGVLSLVVGDLVQWYWPHRPGRARGSLKALARLLAPFVPHLAEAIHRRLEGQKAQSVHLDPWLTVDPAWEDEALLAQMVQVGSLADLAREARRVAGLGAEHKLRQALVVVGAGDEEGRGSLAPFRALLAEAMGVAQVRFTGKAASLVGWRLRPDPERMAIRGVEQADLEEALASLGSNEVAELISQLGEGLSARFTVAGQLLTLLPDEVQIRPEARPGWTAAADAAAGMLVVLTTD